MFERDKTPESRSSTGAEVEFFAHFRGMTRPTAARWVHTPELHGAAGSAWFDLPIRSDRSRHRRGMLSKRGDHIDCEIKSEFLIAALLVHAWCRIHGQIATCLHT
ncbi:hypothetical protein RRG08_027136 [Elysia crispata]|uniref:Uncharacterized protein n=1 Tax=Elysia crispata TaxID=231223 RepID=A0AAE0YVE9_9GAST|nr:hypothetical protein RRG08_027136 [Elysia crispata]